MVVSNILYGYILRVKCDIVVYNVLLRVKSLVMLGGTEINVLRIMTF